ncbi:MAG: RNA-binding S4 domain-containing protein [Paludibacter sp.]|jgi:ribosome-associated heat shock protein Hsp15|nr:RNA-binding S4 domain-containing protein [Paludibacter sp.]
MKSEVRIDKWIWAVRLFKTRTIAAEQCKKGKVLVNQAPAKPSRSVKVGDTVQVKRNPVLYSFKVLALTENRLGAKLVTDYRKDVTTPDMLALIELGKIAGNGTRDRGAGRPTKKERRDIDEFTTPFFVDEDEFDWNE